LLKVFISRESKRILLFFENSDEEINFITVIKKVIISTEPIFQVCAVQCLCHILSESSFAETPIQMLIIGSIPELLFEVIHGNNELLIETVLCCLLMFTHYSLFFEKCHILYGITTVLEIATKLLNNKNWKLLCLSFDLLISLTSSEQYSKASSAQSSLFEQALKLIEKSYRVRNLQVLLAVNKFFNQILRILREHSQDFYTAEERFSCPTINIGEESTNSLSKINFQEVIQTLILSLDEIFVPYCLLLNTNSLVGKFSFFHLINALHAIYEEPFDNLILLSFAKKLVKAKVFNHIWDVKTDGILLSKIGFEGSKEKCNHCLVALLKFMLDKHGDFDTHMNCIKSGLNELNSSMIMWDALSKITFFSEVYTHHEVLLWWCFRNPQFNPFGSFVFQNWMKFSMNINKETILYSTFKILLQLLSTNVAAQETYIRQFESNPEISFNFLRNSFDSKVFKALDTTIIEKLEIFILALAQHIQNYIMQILVMKNHVEKQIDGSLLSVGLECMIWCFSRVHSKNPQINMKFVFHVTNFCSNSSFEDKITLLYCLKFLQFVLKVKENDSKAWFVITGNTNFFPFLKKCLTVHGQFETEALHLLVIILIHQVDGRLKSSSSMEISVTYILKWFNNPNTKLISFELLDKILDTEFNGTFLRIGSVEPSIISSEKSLNRNDIRLLVFHAQNALLLGDPTVEKVAYITYMKLLNYISKADSALENYIMLQPWSRILLESKLDDILVSWKLFEKWFSYKTENITLVGVMQQFANGILTSSEDFIQSELNITKLCSGVYKKYISKQTKNELVKIIQKNAESVTTQDIQESNVISEVENLVTNYISKISATKKTK
ncbi:meiosis inhibitor protein 1, partial [Trichonephila clavata]